MPAIRLPIGTDRLVIRPLRPDDAVARRALDRFGSVGTGESHWNGHLMAFYLCEQPGMSEADVVAILDALAGLRLALDGGWGVDALVGGRPVRTAISTSRSTRT